MRLQELGRRRRLVVELGNVAVPLRVVVVGVDHDLARQRLDRDVPVVLERMVTTTMSPAFAASAAVAARAFGPSSATSAARVSGPRELLITTS